MSDDLIEEARYGAEVERDAAGPLKAIGLALTAGGVLGLVMSWQEPGLSRRERIAAATGSVASLALGVGDAGR